ncbi:MAG: hypothetical protein U1E29_06545 [Coriobacteriia bacterium]|nr:hypothetical protein [Coriobacteriia bacterium]
MRILASRLVPAVLLIALVTVLALSAGCSGGANAGAAANALAVNDIASDPNAFTGTIAVKGVVQNVDAINSSIAIIDETEYATCGLTVCNSAGIIPLFLPTAGEPSPGGALYSGSLPELEDVVVVVGEIKSAPDGLFFDVERVERSGASLIAKK